MGQGLCQRDDDGSSLATPVASVATLLPRTAGSGPARSSVEAASHERCAPVSGR